MQESMKEEEHFNFKNRLGEKHITKEGYEVEIIEYIGSMNCTIMFTYNGCVLKERTYSEIRRGAIKNPYHPSVCGVGYLGQGTYLSKNQDKISNKCYTVWNGIIQRCYRAETALSKNLAYKNVAICEKWKCFQNFAEWFEENYNPETMQGWHLDKDIKIKNSRVYSPETCILVPPPVNLLFIKHIKLDRSLPIGVSRYNRKFRGAIGKNFSKTCSTPEEAFTYYKEAIEKRIKETADEWKPYISEELYNILINYQTEIEY